MHVDFFTGRYVDVHSLVMDGHLDLFLALYIYRYIDTYTYIYTYIPTYIHRRRLVATWGDTGGDGRVASGVTRVRGGDVGAAAGIHRERSSDSGKTHCSTGRYLGTGRQAGRYLSGRHFGPFIVKSRVLGLRCCPFPLKTSYGAMGLWGCGAAEEAHFVVLNREVSKFQYFGWYPCRHYG